MLGISSRAGIFVLIILAFIGLVILLTKLKVLPIDSKKLEKIMKWFGRILKLS